MALCEFINESGLKAVVCNEKGKIWDFKKIPSSIKHERVLGTDTYPNEQGEQVLYIWI